MARTPAQRASPASELGPGEPAPPRDAGADAIRAYRAALVPAWGFWPWTDTRLDAAARIGPLLDRVVARTPPDVIVLRRSIQDTAARLHVCRARLVERLGERPWLVPRVGALLPDGAVDPAVPDDDSGIALVHLARREWTRLGYLCWSAGLDAIALPSEPRPARAIVPVYLCSLARAALIAGDEPALARQLRAMHDVVPPARIAEVSARIAVLARATTWFGAPVHGIAPVLAALAARDEEVVRVTLLHVGAPAVHPLFADDESGQVPGRRRGR